MDRRQFLKCMTVLGTGLLTSMVGSACQHQRDDARYEGYLLPEWTGDSFEMMHRIRNGDFQSPPLPSHSTDIVIVGGGLSGLTAAYHLKNESFLLLERETQLGGNAKSGQYGNVEYALGSAYLVDVEGPYGELYDALGLSLKPVPHPTDMAFQYGKFAPLESTLASEFNRLKTHLGQLLEHPDFPGVPCASATPNALSLDRLSFYDYLKNDYSPKLLRYVDAYCYSALGGGIEAISAYAGINFYSEIAGDIYAFPGGNAFVAKKLAQAIGAERVKTNVSTYQITPKDQGVWVSYLDNSSGEAITVAARTAILAIPYYFVPRIVPSLPREEAECLASFEYDAYLVANCCFDTAVNPGGYDHWTPDNPAFTDFIDARYVSGKAPSQPESVITVYAPFRNARAGRAALLGGDKKSLAATIVTQLQRYLPFPSGSLREVRLTRYGHQLLTSRTGIIHKLRGIKKQYGPIVLGHSDGQGMASIESAVVEALWAATQAKSLLSTSPTVTVH